MSNGEEILIPSHQIVGTSGFGTREEMIIVRVAADPGPLAHEEGATRPGERGGETRPGRPEG